MTVVARFLRGYAPYLVGDLMVSTPSVHDVTARFPTVPARIRADLEQDMQYEKWSPHGMVQKVSVLNDQVVLGWAGKMSTAREVVGELREKLTDISSLKHLDEQILSIKQSAYREIGIVGFAMIGGQLAEFEQGVGIVSKEVPDLARVSIVGSGCQSFIKHLRGGERAFKYRESDDWTSSAMDVAQMVGSALSWEMMTYETFDSLYGSGFEIASLNYGKFQKFGGVLYSVWQIAFVGEEVSVDFLHLFRYAYDGDDLIIRALDVEHAGGIATSGEDTCYYVPPVDSKKTYTERTSAQAPDMPGERVLVLALVANDSGPGFMGSFSIFLNQPDLDHLKVECMEGSLHKAGEQFTSQFSMEMSPMLLEKVQWMARTARQQGKYS